MIHVIFKKNEFRIKKLTIAFLQVQMFATIIMMFLNNLQIPDLSSTQSTINSVIANNLTGLALTVCIHLINTDHIVI